MESQRLEKSDFEQLSEFRYQLRRFMRFSEDICHRHRITPLQYLMLLHIRGFPGRDWATVGELAERLQAKHHGVVALVSRGEALGWVERRPGRNDRRVVEIHLTPAGEACVTALAQAHRSELAAMAGQFTVPLPR